MTDLGDRRILEENYEGLQRYLNFLRGRAPDNVLRFNFNGDWIATVETPGEIISDAYFYYDIKILKNIAAVLGKTADEREYTELADRVKVAFNRNCFDSKTEEYASGTETANAMALFLNLVPEKEIGPVSFHLEKDLLDYHHLHLTTGIIGTKYLMPALTATGRSDMAYDLAIQTTYPSWGYMIENGATTLWELWQEKNRAMMNSHDHPALGSVGAWLYRALGGINLGAGAEGYNHIRIEPQMVEDLHWASATISTIRGVVSTSWTHVNGRATLSAIIPVNGDAEIVLTKDMQFSDVTLLEGNRPIWRDNAYIPGDAGIQNVRREGNRIIINAGSGEYSFELLGR